jgi:hypothetical protein
VSLLSPKLRIAMTPNRVAVASGRDYREAVVAASGWAGALEALSGLLAGPVLRGRTSVTLSHHFSPAHLLPPPPVALKPLEMQSWIRDTLARQLGEAGHDWRVTWQAEPLGEPFLASSLEPAHLAELEGVVCAASLKLVEVQPWLAVAWNRQRRRFGRGHAWYALAEPGRLMLLGLDGGQVRSLRSSLIQDDAVAALADLLTREALLAGEAAPAPLWIESVLPHLNWQGASAGRSVNLLASGREALAAMLEA